MKTTFKRLTIIFSCMLVMSSAHAYKYIIYTDETDSTKAKEVSEMMKATFPFTKFDIEVETVILQPQELNCGSALGIDRLVVCDNSDMIQKKTMKAGGDQAMIIKDSTKYGGSSQVGGGVPVMTTAASARVMLHEYMHTLGLCDEYEYAANEAEIYCGGRNKPNLIFIEPLDPYSSDSMAKARHSSQIPWVGDILPSTPLTNTGGTRLGTGDVDFNKKAPLNSSNIPQALSEPTGLYKGKICNKAVPMKTSWHPGGGATIMENTGAGLGLPLEKVVEKVMISKGARLKLQYEEEVPEDEQVETSSTDVSAGKVVATSQPPKNVNNSARSFFKSLFNWTKDAFQNVKKVLSL